jgi:hypothetical protein
VLLVVEQDEAAAPVVVGVLGPDRVVPDAAGVADPVEQLRRVGGVRHGGMSPQDGAIFPRGSEWVKRLTGMQSVGKRLGCTRRPILLRRLFCANAVFA